MLANGWYHVPARWQDAYYWPDWQAGEPPSVLFERRRKTNQRAGRPRPSLLEDLTAIALAEKAAGFVASGVSERRACREVVAEFLTSIALIGTAAGIAASGVEARRACRAAVDQLYSGKVPSLLESSPTRPGRPDFDRIELWERRVREKLRARKPITSRTGFSPNDL